MKKYLKKMYKKAVDLNKKNILNLFDEDKDARLLDLGCDNGALTLIMANRIGTNNTYGAEITDKGVKASTSKGVKVKSFDLNDKFSFPDNYFDAILANQVIEHIYNSDNFVKEIHRILKPDGYAVISTENASSWCNIFASLMGWQIFSLTNFSNIKRGIGNPLSLLKGDEVNLKSWNHVRVYNIKGLNDYFKVANFKIEKIKGSGYFPFPCFFGNFDKTHSHFITFKIRKK